MSILLRLTAAASEHEILRYEVDSYRGEMEFTLRLVLPRDGFLKDDFLEKLDEWYPDPDTGTQFYTLDLDGNDPNHWLRMIIRPKASDIRLACKFLIRDLRQLMH